MERRRQRLMRAPLLPSLALVAVAAAQPVPPRLAALLADGGAGRPVLGWCSGELQPGRRDTFAVALGSAKGGTYNVVGAGAGVIELAAFARQPSLACYTRAEAEKLGRSLRESEAIHGQLTPRWKTTVICGFTDDTSAVCWQYSPADRAFVVVGKWIT